MAPDNAGWSKWKKDEEKEKRIKKEERVARRKENKNIKAEKV